MGMCKRKWFLRIKVARIGETFYILTNENASHAWYLLDAWEVVPGMEPNSMGVRQTNNTVGFTYRKDAVRCVLNILAERRARKKRLQAIEEDLKRHNVSWDAYRNNR